MFPHVFNFFVLISVIPLQLLSWLNDGIAGKLFVKLTGMMSCGGRVHLKVNKSWIFLKYMPGVLKTSAQI